MLNGLIISQTRQIPHQLSHRQTRHNISIITRHIYHKESKTNSDSFSHLISLNQMPIIIMQMLKSVETLQVLVMSAAQQLTAVVVVQHVLLVDTSKGLDFGCRCFNVLLNTICHKSIVKLKLITSPNFHQLVKAETRPVWTNSLEEATNLDGPTNLVIVSPKYCSETQSYNTSINNKPIWSPKKTETSSIAVQEMLLLLLLIQICISDVMIIQHTGI